MPKKELVIPSSVRSYQEYPDLIELEGCPRCNSLDVNPKIVTFKKNDIKFNTTCFNCGLMYDAYEKIDEKTSQKTIVLEWEL